MQKEELIEQLENKLIEIKSISESLCLFNRLEKIIEEKDWIVFDKLQKISDDCFNIFYEIISN